MHFTLGNKHPLPFWTKSHDTSRHLERNETKCGASKDFSFLAIPFEKAEIPRLRSE
jgi:hypothetical protein